MSQKQFANINNVQCQERSRWEDAQGLERSLAVLSLRGLPSAPRPPARGWGVRTRKTKQEMAIRMLASALPQREGLCWPGSSPHPHPPPCSPRERRSPQLAPGAAGLFRPPVLLPVPRPTRHPPTAPQRLHDAPLLCAICIIPASHRRGLSMTVPCFSLLLCRNDHPRQPLSL